MYTPSRKVRALDWMVLLLIFLRVFFYLVKEDTMKAVQEYQRAGKGLGALNSTFLDLIPKKQNPSSFEEFRPISCCNVVYKIIAKTIAQRMKPILSEIIS